MKDSLKILCKNNDKTYDVPVGSSLLDIFKLTGLDMKFGPI